MVATSTMGICALTRIYVYIKPQKDYFWVWAKPWLISTYYTVQYSVKHVDYIPLSHYTAQIAHTYEYDVILVLSQLLLTLVSASFWFKPWLVAAVGLKPSPPRLVAALKTHAFVNVGRRKKLARVLHQRSDSEFSLDQSELAVEVLIYWHSKRIICVQLQY